MRSTFRCLVNWTLRLCDAGCWDVAVRRFLTRLPGYQARSELTAPTLNPQSELSSALKASVVNLQADMVAAC